MAHSLVVTDSIVFSSPTRFQSHRKHGVRINEAKDHPTHYVATHLQPPDLTARGLPRDDLSQSSPYLCATHECRTVCCSLDVSPEVQMQTLLTLKCCFTSTETVGLLGTGAQDGHLDFHTAPGTDTDLHGPIYIYIHRSMLICLPRGSSINFSLSASVCVVSRFGLAVRR